MRSVSIFWRQQTGNKINRAITLKFSVSRARRREACVAAALMPR